MTGRKLNKIVFDSLQIYVRGGAGGQGLPSMGGHGGKGSDIFAVCREKASLGKLKHDVPSVRLEGKSGERSSKFALKGKDAPEMHIYLPPGVQIKEANGRIMGELNVPGEKLFLAKGGTGGCPGTGFNGKRGERKNLSVDLRLLADIGLVGFPNAGKSSLLSLISRARPRIASFPFTTLKPQIGTMLYEDSRKISVADLPGLIEGAHENKGLGHRFLKHIERTQLMVFVVAANGFQLNQNSLSRNAVQTTLLLNQELEQFNPKLISKPFLIAVNKMDLPGSDKAYQEIKDFFATWPRPMQSMSNDLRPRSLVEPVDILPISCQTGSGLHELKEKVRHWLDVIDDRKRESELLENRQLMLESNSKSNTIVHSNCNLV